VTAELVGMGVQNLRLYEARGLLMPQRTPAGTRRYSGDDVERLRRIGVLLDSGLNLAGIAMVLDLQDENTALRTFDRGTGLLPGIDASSNAALLDAADQERRPRRTLSVRDCARTFVPSPTPSAPQRAAHRPL